MSYLINSNAKLVITDYNFLDDNPEKWWVHNYTDNFLIYDKSHRFEQNEKVIHQKNVGANIYDFYTFVVNNYDNLPEIMIFCKGNVVPRHCGLEKFNNIINNTSFTTIENYIREAPKYKPGIYAYVDENDGYHESPIEVDSTVARIHHGKYIKTFNSMMYFIFENPKFENYIRFAPGANFIVSKKEILRYNHNFYKKMQEFTSWHHKPGEAYILERALIKIFENDFVIKHEFKNN